MHDEKKWCTSRSTVDIKFYGALTVLNLYITYPISLGIISDSMVHTVSSA